MFAHLGMINLEGRCGQHASLNLAQDLADLVHGLVHRHDGDPGRPLQPPVLAVCALQHTINQVPAWHSFVLAVCALQHTVNQVPA